MKLQVTIEIEAPLEAVWPVMIDVEGWSRWTASIKNVERLDGGRFGEGSRFRIRQPRFPTATWHVTTYDDASRFIWVNRSPGMVSTAEHRVEANPAGGTTVTLSLAQEGLFAPLFAAMTRRVSERYMHMEADGLKRESEARSRHPADPATDGPATSGPSSK